MRSALGKGLGALISDEAVANVSSTVKATGEHPASISVDKIRANAKQPRRTFVDEGLEDLAASIKQKGILQPIVVTPIEEGFFEIIAGERRFRAAQRAGLTEVPIVIRTGTEVERFEMALIENLQREDLNPVELAEGFKRLQDEFQMTQEAIAQVVGKDRTVIANTLRFLGLPSEIRLALRDGRITGGHAKALLSVEDPSAQKVLFDQIMADRLTVRHAENAAREHKRGNTPEHLRVAGYEARSPEIRALEGELQQILTRKIQIHAASPTSAKGVIRLEYYSLDDFDHLITLLKKAAQA